MRKIINAFRYLFTDSARFFDSLVLRLGFWLPDKLYIKIRYRCKMRYWPNLKNPKTFNEKLQWLKLYNRKPEYTTMVDKYAVKEYIASKIGSGYIISTLGIWNTPDEIDWEKMPNQFVLKTTHGGGGGGVVICKDKTTFNKEATKNKLWISLKSDIYKTYREWPYKNVQKRIIAETLLEEIGKISPDDYKVLCFDGKVQLIEYHNGRYSEHHTQDFYDRDWKKTKITQGAYGEFSDDVAPKPALLNEMIRLSEILAEGIPHIRVDWYIVNNHLYFGELTFFDGSGMCPFDRYEDDLLLGSWITLPKKQ